MTLAQRLPASLVAPTTRGGYYQRQRLLDILASHSQSKLVVITAPAGYGKTSLVSSYLAQARTNVSWFTLDESYRDSARFLNHLALAVQAVSAAPYRDSIGTPPAGDGFWAAHAELVDALASSLEGAAEGGVLVLDGFEALSQTEAAVRAVDLLIPRLPAGCQLILLSRTRPTLPSLPRLLTYGQALRLTAQDLAFTEEETEGWLQAKDLGLEAEARQLWSRYEGWIAGMALAVNESAGGAGDERGWFEYLEAEVFQSLSPQLQGFLEGTSILTELEPGLCDGLLGADNSLELLKSLADTWNLLQRVPKELKFRCPAGLRRFLAYRLQERGEAGFAGVHQRAARYFQAREDWEGAIRHFCAAGQPERVAEALQQAAPDMYTAGEWGRLAELIDLLPEAILDRYPALLIYRARCAAQIGDGEGALRLSGQALDLLHEGPDLALAQAHVTRAAAFRLTGLLDRATQECSRSIALLQDAHGREARLTLAESYHLTGQAANQGGRLQDAKAALEQALALYHDDGDLYHIAYVNHHLGSVNRGLGEFSRSAACYRAAEKGYRKLGNRAGLASTLNNLANLLHSQGRLQAAEEALTESARHAEESGNPRVLSHALDSLGDVLRHGGQYTRALTTYRQGLDAARSVSEHKTQVQAAEGIALCHLALGDFMAARMTIEEAVGQTGAHTGAEILGRLLTSQSVVQRSLGLHQEARRSILQARQLLEQSGTAEAKARCAFNYAALLWTEHETGVGPLLEEIVNLLPAEGSEALLLFEARAALPFVQHLTALKQCEGVFQRLLEAITAMPGEAAAELAAASIETRPAIRAYGLGTAVVDRADQNPSRVRWPSEKAKELFFFLLLRNGPAQKEEILDAIWPDADPSKADTQFWTAAYRMRNAVHPDCLVREGSTYRLNPALQVWFDVHEFEGLIGDALRPAASDTERASRLQRAINLYNGPFLREFYSEWPEHYRTRLEDRYLAALVALAQLWSGKGAVDPVVELCDRALAVNTFHEEAACLKIEALARAGRVSEAEAAFQAHAAALRDELQEKPGERVMNVYRLVVQQSWGTTPSSSTGRGLAAARSG